MKKSIIILGVGNCGNQVASLAVKKYPELFDAIAINSSQADLSMISKSENILTLKIGNNDEVEGSAKNRTKMKEYLKNDIMNILGNQNLQEMIASKKYCYIISSAGGGTGSASAPILMDILRTYFPDTNFILIGVLPALGSSICEHGNAEEYLKEVFEILGTNTTYMMYDNDATSNLPSIKGLEIVNENIVEDLRVLSGIDNYPAQFDSIDEADLESIITTPGRLMVTRITKGLTEKNLEDNNLDDIIINGFKKSCHAETDRNKVITRMGIITYFTPAVNNLYTTNFEKVYEFIGTPIERFNHNAVNDKNESMNFMDIIVSGLSPVNDRARKIKEKIEELKTSLASDDASQYIFSGESTSYYMAAIRKKQIKKETQVEKFNPLDFFNKYQ